MREKNRGGASKWGTGALFSFGLLGACAGSAGLVLKAPARDQCEQAGLKGCPELSEGVLLYVEGRKVEGREKLLRGGSQNTPDELRRYATLVRTLAELPGASSYSAPILEVASLLEGASVQGSTSAASGSSGAAVGASTESPRFGTSGDAGSGPVRGDFPARVLTADTDPAQARDGMARPPHEAEAWCTAELGANTQCRVLVRGPLYLTDAIASRGDCEGQSLAILRRGKLRMRFDDLKLLRGMRIFIAPLDALVLAQHSPPAPPRPTSKMKSAGSEVLELEETIPSRSCELYWSGFAPYGMRPSSPVDLDEVLDF